MRAIAAAFGLALGVVALGAPSSSALVGPLVALAAAVALGAAAVGGGGALLAWGWPALARGPLAALHALALGAGMQIALAATLVLVGGSGRAWFALAGLLPALGWAARPALAPPRPGPAAWVGLAVLGVVGLPVALGPATDTDELYQHLVLPASLLRGDAPHGWLEPNGSRPLGLPLWMAPALALGGDAAPRVLHLGLAVGLVLGVDALAAARGGRSAAAVAVAVLVGSHTFAWAAPVLGTDLPAAFVALLLLDAAGLGAWALVGLLGGLGAGLKPTVLGPFLGALLVGVGPWRARLGAVALAGLLVAPWPLRNLWHGLHPLFPFAGWPEPLGFMAASRYGAGRSPVDFLLLPWRVCFDADPSGLRFLGRLSPAVFAGVVGGVLALRHPGARRAWAAALPALLLWAAGPHVLRFLLPALPALALAVGASARGPRVAAFVLAAGLAGAAANLGPAVQRTGDRVAVLGGAESTADFAARRLEAASAVAFVRAHLADDARVALLYAWSAAPLGRPTLLGSVEDHIPVRHLLLAHGAGAFDVLRAAGVTHLLVGPARIPARAAPELDAQAHAAAYEAPATTLARLLHDDAVRIFVDGPYAVYRLEPDHPPPLDTAAPLQ